MKLGIYRHYKGNYYLVLGVGFHTETNERLVVYVPLYLREGPRIACRPYDEFNSTVDDMNYHQRNRFEYIGEEIPDSAV